MNIKTLWGRIKCLFGKHGRGYRLLVSQLTPAEQQRGLVAYQCRRCPKTWTRKAPKPEPKA